MGRARGVTWVTAVIHRFAMSGLIAWFAQQIG